jgi:S1-C subfamily serine protease
MPQRLFTVLLTITTLLLSACVLVEAQTPNSASDLADYRTIDNAKTTTIAKTGAPASGLTGYLGASTVRDSTGRLVVDDVQPDSPGAKAGIVKGDSLAIDDHPVTSPLTFREWIRHTSRAKRSSSPWSATRKRWT